MMRRFGLLTLLIGSAALAQPSAPAPTAASVASAAAPSAPAPAVASNAVPTAAAVPSMAAPSRSPAAPESAAAASMPSPASAASSALAGEEPPPALELDAQPEALALVTTRLQAFAAGRLTPEVRSAELFVVDLLDDAAVAKRLVELRRRVEYARAQADALQVRADRTPDEAQRLIVLQRLLALDGVRLEVLSRGRAERQALLDAEAAGLKVAAERAAAESARLSAEEASRAATAAQAVALAEEKAAVDATTRELAGARGDLEARRATVAGLREVQARQKQKRAEQHALWVDLLGRAKTALAEKELTADRADTLYSELVSALEQARSALSSALGDTADVQPPSTAPSINVDAPQFRASPLERDAVVQVQDRLIEEANAWALAERQRRATRMDDVAGDLSALNRVRLQMIARLAPATREVIMGLGREGLGQLSREVEHLSITAQWYVRSQRPTWARVKAGVFEALGRASGRWDLIKLLVLLILGVYIWRWPLQLRIDAWVRSRRADYTTLIWRGLRPLWRPMLLLVWMWGLFAVLESLMAGPVVAVCAGLAFLYGFYRLISAGAHHGFLQLATNPALPVSAELSRRIQRTVQWVTRYAFTVLAFLLIAEALVGRGYLYGIVNDFAWLAALPLTWWILRHWRDDLLRAWLVRHPEGWLVERAKQGLGRLAGILWAAPIAVRLLVETVAEGATSFALRLSQLRRGFAFLLRRQLERQLEDETLGPRQPLPPSTLARLMAPDALGDLRIGPLPQLDRGEAELTRWRTVDAPAGPVALIGARGIGKSIWLQAMAQWAQQDAAHPVALLTLEAPRVTPAELVPWLAAGLGHPEAHTVDALTDALLAGPRRVVLLDDTHLAVRRAAGGTAAIIALFELIRRTSAQVFWVCGFARPLWGWTRFALQNPDLFNLTITLEPWSEDRLDALLKTRLAALGLTPDFRSLLPKRLRGVPAEAARTELRFKQLLWDAAAGLPEPTLHYWAASLDDRGNGRVEVRLFDEVDPNDLERLNDAARLALNATLMHDRLGLPWASAVLHTAPADCHALLEQLRAMGCIDRHGDLYSVPVRWLCATTRFLQRKHLLHV